MPTQKILHTVNLLLSGSELMSGDTIDTNSALLAKILSRIGIEIAEKATVPDDLHALTLQIKRLSENCQLLIINGGLGPTSDDLTAEAISVVLGEPLTISPDAEQHILKWCAERSIHPNAANMKQALLPHSATIFPNCPGSAPAFSLRIDECLVIATPGVPSELDEIASGQLTRFISREFLVEAKKPWKKHLLIGMGESRLQQTVKDKLPDMSAHLEIGYRVDFPLLEFKYRPRHEVPWQHERIKSWELALEKILDGHEACTENGNFARELVHRLKTHGGTFSCAESCTGGLIASMITSVSGASTVFPGGIVSYSNEAKQKLLMVPQQTLMEHGAVSRETAEAMLQGVLDQMGSKYGVAVTGIAGPDGGSAEKPVGTVWIAWGTANHFQTVCLRITLERTRFQQLVSSIALDLCSRWISGKEEPPSYLSRWEL
jgi:nicotinamide-nucleotide amidase